MLIVCPNCATSYQITSESLGESGRNVRCLSCYTLWFEAPPMVGAPFEIPVGAGTGETAHAVEDRGGDTAHLGPIRPPLDDVVAIDEIYEGETPGTFDGLDAAHSEAAEFHNDPPDEDLHNSHLRDIELRRADPHGDFDDDAPSIVPHGGPVHDDRPARAPRSVERAARAGRARQKPFLHVGSWRRHVLPITLGAMLVVLAGLIAARHQVVSLLPQTASLYAAISLPVNLRGLAFDNVRITREVQDGTPMVVVEGEIVGTGRGHAEIPRLRFAVTDRAGKEIYAWTAQPDRTLLAPGQTLPFRSRLASPPTEASEVTVRFFNRRDAQAGFM